MADADAVAYVPGDVIAAMEADIVAEHGPFLLLKTRVIPTRDASYDEWDTATKWAQSVEHASPFWVGDLLKYGEGRYGEMYTQAIEATGLTYESLSTQAYVAANVAPEVRREGLSFSHHREVAPLPPDEQVQWLDKAEAEQLTRDQLRTQIKVAQGKASSTAVDLWLTVYCADIDDLNQLAERMKSEGRSVKLHAKES